MRNTFLISTCLLLAACGGEPANVTVEPSNTVAEQVVPLANNAAEVLPADDRPLLNLAPGALSLVDPNSGRSRELAFGLDRATVEDALALALDKPSERGSNRECGEGAMDFARMPGGLRVWFQDGKFAGWFIDDAGAKLTTASGIGIGSTRKELTGAYDAEISESSLGEEFAAGELSGLLSGKEPTAKVTAIWSGQVCNFR
jgi:hypothetical protein